MNCPDVRNHLIDLQRDRLAPELQKEIARHLETCAACARANDAERVLSSVLEGRLPRYSASPELKRRLAQVAAPAAAPALATAFALRVAMLMHSMARVRWMRAVAPALAALLVVGGAIVVVNHVGPRQSG